jgi:uncharacterized protein (DUF362 family)
VGVTRIEVSRSYAGVGTLLQAYIDKGDAAAWEKIRAKIDYTYEGLDLALAPLEAETGFGAEIRARLEKGQKLLFKPNLVNVDRQLTSTHVECLEGILEFLGPLVRDEIGIAETPANGPAAEAFSNYGLYKLRDKYRVRFVDLDEQPFETEYLVDERYQPKPVRFSRFLLDPDTYYISTAPFKTHDRAVVTLGLKNFVVGGILKDVGYRWGAGSRGVTDKHIVHGGPENQAINYNLFKLALRRHPDLSVLDGFEGMEHNGPISGTPVDHRVAVASADWLVEVDCVVDCGTMVIPIEIKSARRVALSELRGLRTFLEDYSDVAPHGYVVTMGDRPEALAENITALPWRMI